MFYVWILWSYMTWHCICKEIWNIICFHRMKRGKDYSELIKLKIKIILTSWLFLVRFSFQSCQSNWFPSADSRSRVCLKGLTIPKSVQTTLWKQWKRHGMPWRTLRRAMLCSHTQTLPSNVEELLRKSCISLMPTWERFILNHWDP